MWPRAIEIEIGTAVYANGAERALTFFKAVIITGKQCALLTTIQNTYKNLG